MSEPVRVWPASVWAMTASRTGSRRYHLCGTANGGRPACGACARPELIGGLYSGDRVGDPLWVAREADQCRTCLRLVAREAVDSLLSMSNVDGVGKG